MVSKEAGRCTLSSSESDSESGGPSLEWSGADTVRKRNKALQVRFKDICEAQNEAAHRGARDRSVSCKVIHRRYMTMPARRSIPNVTKSTGVQTSPDLKKRYQTFPFERKKGNVIKHTALVENYPDQNNGFLSDVKGGERGTRCEGQVQQTRVLLHTTPQCSDAKDLCAGLDCSDGKLCPDLSDSVLDQSDSRRGTNVPGSGAKHKGLPSESEAGAGQQPNCASSTTPTQPLQVRGDCSKISGPIAWTSLTQVECPESPSGSCKRKKDMAQLNGLQAQSQALPHSASCASQAQCHSSQNSGAAETRQGMQGQLIALPGADGNAKARLQAMEALINSSQETIKVLLGVIQELERGEAQREGLSYRTGQDTANCDTCRNSACIIYSVELDFKLQEDKLQPLMKRLCPLEEPSYPSLPYTHEVFTSTPKRKSKTVTKKHARWKLWFL
ncbi:protein FAM196A isoform X1 [Sinocyclocheilus anshuiensis]|uniref:Protein FAM196A-like n=1 Tax=Sinocyclocheilus anshuiensis TaxID=1608454 RepID=A0A671N9R2_9TELE|nr:PREDICTED: protein FAM196A-like isoform X1 [Sinocyclocheilus anshuiensis]